MFTLLSECHFWTTQDEIRIKPGDLGAYKYLQKKDYNSSDLWARGKTEYAEQRDGMIMVSNKVNKLRDNLAKLEELLKQHKVVFSEWQDSTSVKVMFSNGIFVSICVNCFTGDIVRIVFDKFFIGKLAAETVVSAVFSNQNIVLSYNTNQITIVHLQKPNKKLSNPEKIAEMEPRIFHVIVAGPSERKLSRYLVVNGKADKIVIWTKSSQNEVFPWRPTVRDQDRANIHIYKLSRISLQSIAYCWTENDPICVEFLKATDNHIVTVEQKVSRKGEITAEICSYDISTTKVQKFAVTSIPIGTQICCHGFSPDQEKLFLGTIDRYCCMHDLPRKITKFASKADIIPTLCGWHADSSLVIVGNDRGQFQCFDIALQFVTNQPISEDVTPSNLYDLTHYFAIQPTLLKMKFSPKPDTRSCRAKYAQTDSFLLLLFENGPLACLKFISAAGIVGDIHNSGLTADMLIHKYLDMNHLEKAVNVLCALNWDTYGAMCLLSLHRIARYVFSREEPKRSRNELLRKAFDSYKDVADDTDDEFGDRFFNIMRNFFYYLLRNELYNETFDIAEEIGDHDLFIDLYHRTKSIASLENFSQECYRRSEEIFNCDSESGSSGSETCTCSQSSCSECNSPPPSPAQLKSVRKRNSVPSKEPQRITAKVAASNLLKAKSYISDENHIKQVDDEDNESMKNYVPPLPYFRTILSSENIKIPKPELRIDKSEYSTTKIATARKIHKSQSKEVKLSSSDHLVGLPVSEKASTGGHPQRYQKNQKLQLSPFSSSPTKSAFTQYQPLEPQRKTLSVHKSWSQIPDQTLGTALIPQQKQSSLSHSLSMLPQAITATTAPLSPSVLYSNQNLHSEISASVTSIPTMLPHSYDLTDFRRLQVASPTAQKSESLYNLPKFYQHPLVSGTIPPTILQMQHSDKALRLKKPSASILSNSSNIQTSNGQGVSSNNVNAGGSGSGGLLSTPKKDTGEKNKVKFSDTVQVAVVPEISRKEKPQLPKRNGFHSRMTDQQRELADSLPLCHPNDDYLKDFNPVSELDGNNKDISEGSVSQTNQTIGPGTIKVVHFGVV